MANIIIQVIIIIIIIENKKRLPSKKKREPIFECKCIYTFTLIRHYSVNHQHANMNIYYRQLFILCIWDTLVSTITSLMLIKTTTTATTISTII